MEHREPIMERAARLLLPHVADLDAATRRCEEAKRHAAWRTQFYAARLENLTQLDSESAELDVHVAECLDVLRSFSMPPLKFDDGLALLLLATVIRCRRHRYRCAPALLSEREDGPGRHGRRRHRARRRRRAKGRLPCIAAHVRFAAGGGGHSPTRGASAGTALQRRAHDAGVHRSAPPRLARRCRIDTRSAWTTALPKACPNVASGCAPLRYRRFASGPRGWAPIAERVGSNA